MSDPKGSLSREELHALVWARPFVKLAKELGYAYTELVALCEQFNIPRPAGGYWYRRAHATAEPVTDLPPAPVGVPPEIPLGPRLAKEEPVVNPAQAGAEDKAVETVAAPADDGEPKAATAAGEPASAAVGMTPRVMEPEEAAEAAVLNVLRQRIALEFWRDSVDAKVHASALGGWLGLGRDCRFSTARLVRAVKGSRKEYRTFKVEVNETRDRYRAEDTELAIAIRLREGCEWKEALDEAWSVSEKPNPHGLSDNGWRLYQWAKGPKNTGTMTAHTRIGAQARLRGTYFYIEKHLQEIRTKADAAIQWEKGSTDKSWRDSYRVWFETKNVAYYHHGPLNPALGLYVVEPGHADWERLREWFYAEVLNAGYPDGTETVGLFDIRSRRAASAAFKRYPMDHVEWGPLPDFFDQWRLADGIEVRFAFHEEAWLVTCTPAKGESWHGIKERLRAKAKEIPLEQRYELSADSLALLRWILELRRDELLMGMTPTVEDELDKNIGINVEWGKENVRTYLELLVQEINEKTEFKLRVLPWHEHGADETRILVKKKAGELDELVRSIQMLALRNGKMVQGEEVRTTIERLMG